MELGWEGAGQEAGGAGLPDSATLEGRGRGRGQGARGGASRAQEVRGRSPGGVDIQKAGSRRLGPRPLTRPPAKTRRSPGCSRAARRCRSGALFLAPPPAAGPRAPHTRAFPFRRRTPVDWGGNLLFPCLIKILFLLLVGFFVFFCFSL